MYVITDKNTDEILYVIRDNVTIPSDGVTMVEIQELQDDGTYKPTLIGGGDITASKVTKRNLTGKQTPVDLKEVRKYKYNGTNFTVSDKYEDYLKEKDIAQKEKEEKERKDKIIRDRQITG